MSNKTKQDGLTKTENFYLRPGKGHKGTQTCRDAFQLLSLKREPNFRLKTVPMMKGCSKLSIGEKRYYDTKSLIDPNAKRSRKMRYAGIHKKTIIGDKDVWIEQMVFQSDETVKTETFFVSDRTGKKVEQEPPTGASRVIYLRESYRIRDEGNEE